jgi:hypothetical protein
LTKIILDKKKKRKRKEKGESIVGEKKRESTVAIHSNM